MDLRFGRELRRLREHRGYSQAELGKLAGYDPSYVSKIENGKVVGRETAAVLDTALRANGALMAYAPPAELNSLDLADPWETAELAALLETSRIGHGAIARLQQTVERLCCEYSGHRPATLRREAQEWLKFTAKLAKQSPTYTEHGDLLVIAGWLALLVGCLEHDLGMPSAAEATRAAAASLGAEARHSEIVGWSFEMSAWMALTRDDPHGVLTAARAGQEACHGYSVVGQLAGLEAKALARLGRGREVHDVLDRGFTVLTNQPPSVRSANHFVVDPSKWNFLAMDCYRVVGDDDRAVECAEQIIGQYTLPDGRERSPMRVSEARMTLAVVAARTGDVERAVDEAGRALGIERRSLPSLLLPARELLGVLEDRCADDVRVRGFRDQLRSLVA